MTNIREQMVKIIDEVIPFLTEERRIELADKIASISIMKKCDLCEGKKEIYNAMKRHEPCFTCKGEGEVPMHEVKCPMCMGRKTYRLWDNDKKVFGKHIPCENCKGTGKITYPKTLGDLIDGEKLILHILDKLNWAFQFHDDKKCDNTLTCWGCELRTLIKKHLQQKKETQ